MTPQREKELYRELKKQSSIKAKIFLKFIIYHRGIENAIARDEFLSRHDLETKISDRDFRKFYSTEIPVAYVNMKGKKGIFWPAYPGDMKPVKDLRKKALSMLSRAKRIEDKHFDLMIYEQMEFEEMRQ